MPELLNALVEGDAMKAQELARSLIAKYPNPWQRSDLQDYCRVRWTSRFLTAAEQDGKALPSSASRQM